MLRAPARGNSRTCAHAGLWLGTFCGRRRRPCMIPNGSRCKPGRHSGWWRSAVLRRRCAGLEVLALRGPVGGSGVVRALPAAELLAAITAGVSPRIEPVTALLCASRGGTAPQLLAARFGTTPGACARRTPMTCRLRIGVPIAFLLELHPVRAADPLGELESDLHACLIHDGPSARATSLDVGFDVPRLASRRERLLSFNMRQPVVKMR